MKTHVQRQARPDRTEIRDSNNEWLATLFIILRRIWPLNSIMGG
jgi:hypothetical protein